jgi:dipeptidyl aminopeptidase/acylaminoacyl peptidase
MVEVSAKLRHSRRQQDCFRGDGVRSILWAALAVVAALCAPAYAQPAPPPPLEAYAALPAVREVALSPSGERVAMIVGEGDGQRLVVTDQAQNALLVSEIGKAQIGALVWAGDEHLLVQTEVVHYDRRRNAAQRLAQTFHVDLRTRKSRLLLAKSQLYDSGGGGVVGVAQEAGRWTAYLTGIPDDAGLKDFDGRVWPSLYRVDLENGRTSLVDPAQNEPKSWSISPAGDVRGLSVYTPRDNTWRLYAGAASGPPLLEREWTGYGYALAGAGRTPGSLVFGDWAGDASALYEVSPDQKAPVELIRSQGAFRPLHDPLDGRLLGVAMSDGEVTLFDAELKRRFEAARRAYPGKQVKLVSYSTGFDRLVVYTHGLAESGTYWLVDIATGSAKVLGIVRPGVTDDAVAPMRTFHYRAADGLELDGVLTMPLGEIARPLALVVLPLGDFPAPAAEIGFNWVAQAFASRGYAVFEPNPRGVQRRGDARWKAGDGELAGKVLTDISDGVAALAAEGLVDPKRVCVMGEAIGGYLALSGVTLQQGLYRCAVSVGGFSDVQPRVTEFSRENLKPDKRRMETWRRATGVSDAQAAKLISPVEQAMKADAPILMVHGEDDLIAPIWESRNMLQALTNARKPVELITIKREGHELKSSAARQQMLSAAVGFVEKHNPAR